MENRLTRICTIFNKVTSLILLPVPLGAGSPYRGLVNDAVLRLQESGELRRLRRRWWKDHNGGGCEVRCGLVYIVSSDMVQCTLCHQTWSNVYYVIRHGLMTIMIMIIFDLPHIILTTYNMITTNHNSFSCIFGLNWSWGLLNKS